MYQFNPLFTVQVSVWGSMIYTFNTLTAALKFCKKADGTICNEFGTVLQRGSWDKVW